MNYYLVGGFNPSEKYESKWESSPNRDKIKTIWNHHPDYLFVWNMAKTLHTPKIKIEPENIALVEMIFLFQGCRILRFQPFIFRGRIWTQHITAHLYVLWKCWTETPKCGCLSPIPANGIVPIVAQSLEECVSSRVYPVDIRLSLSLTMEFSIYTYNYIIWWLELRSFQSAQHKQGKEVNVPYFFMSFTVMAPCYKPQSVSVVNMCNIFLSP